MEINKHLFFDLDRTLWDFEKNSQIALQQLFLDLNLDKIIPEFDHFHSTYKTKNAELWKLYGSGKIKKEELRTLRFKQTLNSFGLEDKNMVEEISNGYVEISPRQTTLFPGAIETLSHLQQKGYRLHIITNGFKEVQYIKLENSGLSPFFDIVICSEEVGKNKPAPDIFHYALKKAGVSAPSAVMIGDDPDVDVYGAMNAGMLGILFDPYQEHERITDVPKISELWELTDLLPWVFAK